jgi:hypothetical protein
MTVTRTDKLCKMREQHKVIASSLPKKKKDEEEKKHITYVLQTK